MKFRITTLLVLTLGLSVMTSACGLFAPLPMDSSLTPHPSRTATYHATATLSPAEITATAEAMYARQTEAAYQDMQLRIQQVSAESTLIAAQVEATRIAVQQTAIVEGTRAAQTQVAYEATQQSIQSTQSANDRAIQSTQAANATATTIAIAVINANIAGTQAAATSTAQVEQARAAFAGTATQSAFYAQSTVEAASVSALATAQAARAKSAEAAAERIEITNRFMAWADFFAPILWIAGALGILYILGWFWWRTNKAKILQPNAAGAYPLVYDDGRLLNAQRAFGPVVDPRNPHYPQDETIQGQIAMGDVQTGAVRAMAAGGRNPEATARQVQRMVGGGQLPASTREPEFRIIPASEARNALPADVSEIIEAQWKEATNGRHA